MIVRNIMNKNIPNYIDIACCTFLLPAMIMFMPVEYWVQDNPKSTQDKTSVGEEINYISEYIDLQLLRLNEHTNVCFTHQEDDTTLDIAPMILITFIENVFKYGISSHTDGNLWIDIRVENGVLSLVTENPVHQRLLPPQEGIGISNCSRRLDLLYPEAYTLDITKTKELFRVVLTI